MTTSPPGTAAPLAPTPWHLRLATGRSGSTIAQVTAADGRLVGFTVGHDGDPAWCGSAQAARHGHLLRAAPDLLALAEDAAASGGIGPAAHPDYRPRLLAALALMRGNGAAVPTDPGPSRDDLLLALRNLVAWARLMGGWDAPCWADAEDLLARAGMQP